MKKITFVLCCFSVCLSFAGELRWVEPKPASNWQESSLTGNGRIGAMVRGELGEETISLSQASLFLPEPGTNAPVASPKGRSKPGDYTSRDGFMAACDLRIVSGFRRSTQYRRFTDFETGEIVVEAKDGNETYRRRVVALRTENLLAIQTSGSAGNRRTDYTLAGIPVAGRGEIEAFSRGIKMTFCGPRFYRCEYANANPWNDNEGYEVALIVKGTEAFVAIEPLKKGETTNRPTMEARLAAAAAAGYDELLKANAARMGELMGRVSFELEGPDYAAETVRRFNSGRYNIISSVGDEFVPNLQGVWAGTWSAPWKASYTVNGNLPCAISFFDKGNTPEFNESLFAWIEKRLPSFRENAQVNFNARGFRIPAQTTVAGVETDSGPAYPHVYWHGGAAWLLSRLYDGYRTTLDRAWLAKIYPLMKEVAAYYEDVLKEMDDGTLGFDPSYSPENWPEGKRPISVNATMDNAIAKQFLDEICEGAAILGVDGAEVAKWSAMRTRLTPYAVSENGFFAEWLAPGQSDQNNHRHASHLYPLYDNTPAEILTNAAFVAAIRKTIDARMDFNENRSRTMAFGYVQNGLAACKIGDAARAERCLNLLNAKNWLKGGGSCHDWQNCFNADISGGYPYLISEMLVQSQEARTDEKGWIRFLPAKPATWTKGAIRGLRLRGNILLEELAWEGESWKARLRAADGSVKKLSGSGDAVIR